MVQLAELALPAIGIHELYQVMSRPAWFAHWLEAVTSAHDGPLLGWLVAVGEIHEFQHDASSAASSNCNAHSSQHAPVRGIKW